ncbi:bifunctional methylenetetrahydrofolate dehydrogenase/methenyltetrahydrofolate cyclohydrolase FolD [Candidatus Micrarchaeota archaeon]|nr:bifunctional methylenetetrahydrofolate dehydrogenase/methenyltetrahydrofolate cyclohydrolase FolD [Candidatus Micrarchaeota archaeon]
MVARLIDGKQVALQVTEEVKREVAGLKVKPCLDVVLVGDNPASQTYVRMKTKKAEELGIVSHSHVLPSTTTQQELEQLIKKLNSSRDVHGILVQLPLPKHLNEQKIISLISPEKDVDGFHPVNMGKLLRGEKGLLPCTPNGVMSLLDSTGVSLEGKHAVVIGRSNIVGKPTAVLLLSKNCTVTVCHSKSKLEEHCPRADILVAAIGKAKMIGASLIKQGAIVIDVGTNKGADGKLVGDVDFDAVKSKASFITPVPGGVGPMTVAFLMRNTLEACKAQLAK